MARGLSVEGITAIVDSVWGPAWVVKILIHVVGVLLSSHDDGERMYAREEAFEAMKGRIGIAEPNNERLECKKPTVALCGVAWGVAGPNFAIAACVAGGNRVTLLLFPAQRQAAVMKQQLREAVSWL